MVFKVQAQVKAPIRARHKASRGKAILGNYPPQGNSGNVRLSKEQQTFIVENVFGKDTFLAKPQLSNSATGWASYFPLNLSWSQRLREMSKCPHVAGSAMEPSSLYSGTGLNKKVQGTPPILRLRYLKTPLQLRMCGSY